MANRFWVGGTASGTLTLNYGALFGITATGGGTFNATNSYDQGRNTGWIITPSVGGVIGVIGG